MRKIAASLLLLLCSTIAFAQNASSTATQTVNLNLANAISIEFVATNNNTGAQINLAFNTVNDYANGVESADVTLRVRSNKKFEVRTKSNSEYFSYSGTTSPAPQMKVKNVLKMKVTNNSTGGNIDNGYGNYKSIDTDCEDILDNCSNGGNQTFSVKYQATPGFSFPAGTYTADIIYTVVQE